MTIEELADIRSQQRSNARKIQGDAQLGAARQRRMEHLEMDGEEDDEDLADEAAVHDRAWDDWKAAPQGQRQQGQQAILT